MRKNCANRLPDFSRPRKGPAPDPSEHQGKAIKGLVAPNYDVNVAGPIYAWAYKELREAEAPDVYILLGTSHAGLAKPVAVTDKDFESPLGSRSGQSTDHGTVLRSKGGDGLFADELRHETEHSIEFQLPFLQETVGARQSISIIPILSLFPPGCVIDPALKEVADQVERFVAVLKDAIAASSQRVCFLASANLAHIGLRYGDDKAPTDFSFHRCMQTDLEMLKHVENVDAQGFAEFLLKEQDRRHVLGFSAIYLLLRLIEAEKGEVLRYDREIVDQFNSTITYASAAFF